MFADMLLVSAVRSVLAKLVSPLWRTVDDDEWRRTVEDDEDAYGFSPPVADEIRRMRGCVVTQLCQDYGMIDDEVYFTSAEVIGFGRTPLNVGDTVNGIAVRTGPQRGWKALRVEKCDEEWGAHAVEADTLKLRPLIGTVTQFDGRDGGYINQNTFFPSSALMDGYEPMKGDWVQAQYFVNPNQWSSQAQSVAPLRYCRLDQVHITNVYGNKGTVEDNIFFTLDSLLLPADYRPTQGDLVNLVIMESSQSLWSWRALCMAPVDQRANGFAKPLPEADIQNLLQDKKGLEVTQYGDFGTLLLGNTGRLVFWIQNKGTDTHTLTHCEFSGWDSQEQFTLCKFKDPSLAKRGKAAQSQSQDLKNDAASSANGSENGSIVVVGDVNGPAKAAMNDSEPEEELAVTPKPADRTQEMEAELKPGERLAIEVNCTAKNPGSSAELLLLHFSSFTIGRRLEVLVSSQEETLLQPTAPYNPQRPTAAPQEPSRVISFTAPPPQRLISRRLPQFLGHYAVPHALKECVEGQGDPLVVQPCLGEALSASNMGSRFSTLLWIEELNAAEEMRSLTITGALLQKGAGHLHLEVPGLSEGRPNVSVGDRLILKKIQTGGMVLEYFAYVAEIHGETASLRVNPDLQRDYLGEPLDVEFTYNRLTMRRCHQALEQASQFGQILFPSKIVLQKPQWNGTWVEEDEDEKTTEEHQVTTMENGEKVSSISIDMKSKTTQTKGGCLPPTSPREGHLFNPSLNPSQREAVRRILAGECRPTPYVLFGPPGTGKTVTLIEAILQVYHFVPSSRVLVCTPSNSAADLICIRLHHSGFLHAASLARINAFSRQEESIPEVLIQYCRAGDDIRHAAFHRIVVSTCSSAGMLHHVGLHLGHFTHVFVDEAGQATEPEALIPISLVSERNGQIVLVGDPHQLGPVVKSKQALAYGLGVSLLERLMTNPLYSRQSWGYNPKLVTKLVDNYRSHEALLCLPSRLFYHGELCMKASRATVDSLLQWTSLPRRGFPLLFHGLRGKEMREGSNPSWYNPVEAVQVMRYCCQLAKKLYRPVDPTDIGVIAPYRKQSEKISLLLSKVGLSDIKVGSVEEFQGQEYLVIILSTVRSNESLPASDMQNALGFLTNPKRFNVAITRPKALLIIAGNPHILIRDPCFRALLKYSFDNGAFIGCDPPAFLRESSREPEGQDHPKVDIPHPTSALMPLTN